MRTPCCPKEELNRGAWTALEDKILVDYITAHGEGKWRNIPRVSGLKRSGKSCRLRWLNYLRPDIKRGNISPEEEDLIIRLHKLLGNRSETVLVVDRWSLIAGRLPGRTDNEIKNYWNTVVRKKLKGQGNSKDDDSGCALKSPINRNLPVKTSRVADSDVIRVKPARVGAVSTIPDTEMHKDNYYKMGCKVGPEPSIDREQSDEGTKSGGRSPATTGLEEDNALENPTLDFSIRELLASDFSESELWKLCQLESEDMDQQPLLFSEELLMNWTDEGCFQFQD